MREIPRGEGAGGDPLGKVFALDELHDEEVAPGNLFEGEEGRDAGVVEARQQLRLALEAPPPLLVFEELLRQDLQGDGSIDARVLGPVHLPIPPTPSGARIS